MGNMTVTEIAEAIREIELNLETLAAGHFTARPEDYSRMAARLTDARRAMVWNEYDKK